MRDRQTQLNVHYLGLQALGLILLLILISARPVTATARVVSYEEPWTAPGTLSQSVVDGAGSPADSLYPALIADRWGVVHAFWPARLDARLGAVGDVLMYARWNDGAWSTPVDVVYTPGKVLWLPKVAVDAEGWLHLAWLVGAKVQYSRAQAIEARSALAWSEPVEVPSENASGVSIVADGEGTAHIVFCVESGNANSVLHASLADGQVSSEPRTIGYAAQGVCNSNQAVDDTGRQHVVWAAGYSGAELNQEAAAFYSRSIDGGLDWLPQVEIDRWSESYRGNYAPAKISIATIGNDQVHIVWLGRPSGQRWHQWSEDGGATWLAAIQLDADFRGVTEPPAMDADSLGRLHVVSIGWKETGERPFGLYHAYWSEGAWTPWGLVNEQQSKARIGGGERAALAITGGNNLHTIWDVQAPTGIWVSRAVVDAPDLPSEPRPERSAEPDNTQRASATRTAAPIETGSSEEQASVAVTEGTAAPSESASSEGQAETAVLAGAIAAAGLVGLVLLVERWRRVR